MATEQTETLKAAVMDLLFELSNIQAIVAMMDRVDEIHDSDFTDEIAGGIRVIQQIAGKAASRVSAVL